MFSQSEDESEYSELEKSRLPKNLIDSFKKFQPLDKTQITSAKQVPSIQLTSSSHDEGSSASESTIVNSIRKKSTVSKKILTATQSSPCATPTSRGPSIDFGSGLNSKILENENNKSLRCST